MLCSSCWICFRVAVVCCLQVVGFVSELQSYVVFKLMDLFQSCSRMLYSYCWICFGVAVVCCIQVVGFVSELQAAFDMFDQNKDGRITTTELQSVMVNLRLEPTEDELQDMIKRFDQDGRMSILFCIYSSPMRDIDDDEDDDDDDHHHHHDRGQHNDYHDDDGDDDDDEDRDKNRYAQWRCHGGWVGTRPLILLRPLYGIITNPSEKVFVYIWGYPMYVYCNFH